MTLLTSKPPPGRKLLTRRLVETRDETEALVALTRSYSVGCAYTHTEKEQAKKVRDLMGQVMGNLWEIINSTC